MEDYQQPLDSIKQIKQMMERSSRFISLSGWSGVAAGICALAGTWFANSVLPSGNYLADISAKEANNNYVDWHTLLDSQLFWIAVATFVSAFFTAFLFTYLRSKKQGLAVWGPASRRLLINVFVPMIVGGLFLLRLIQLGQFGLIAPGCLIFYGLALVNASKYTLGEIRYLGFLIIVTGLINAWYMPYGLYFWAAGFGVMHILYGVSMWYKHERD